MTDTRIGATEDGQALSIDVPRLIETRMLVEANSGGGKSQTLRKVLEKTHGQVQHIVIDMEGEFGTLREKFDYILSGKGGDIPADPRSAELLARKILELGAPIIIDLYELKHHERIRFVKQFFDAMVNAPKELWHPVLVVLDEAHIFCPEKGESEAMTAVIDLVTRGRKRGFGCILATQRLSKLNKDVAAELINKMIGRTGLDIDQKRAGEELGFTNKQDILSLRDLEPGEFYAFGPALSKQVVKVTVDPVETTHPRAGQRMATIIPTPTAKVIKLLSKLTDLPQAAEEELRSKEDMMRKIRELKAEVRAKPKPAIDDAEVKRIAEKNYNLGWTQATSKADLIVRKGMEANRLLTSKLKRIAEIMGTKIAEARLEDDWKDIKLTNPVHIKAGQYMGHISIPKIPEPPTPQPRYIQEGDVDFGPCERMILKFLSLDANLERAFTREQIGAMTNYSATSGGFKAALQTLRKQTLILGKDLIRINVDEVSRAREISESVQLATLQDWLGTLPTSDRKVYQVLYQNPDQAYTFQDLGDVAGYSATSGGFKASISHLCTLGLAQREDGKVRFNEAIREWL